MVIQPARLVVVLQLTAMASRFLLDQHRNRY